MPGSCTAVVLARPPAADRRRHPAALLLGLAGVLGLATYGAAPTAFVNGLSPAQAADRSESCVALNARNPFPTPPGPQSYARRQMAKGFWFKGRQTCVRVYHRTNKPIKWPMHVMPGDTVQVMEGKDKGKVTQVVQIWPKWNKVLCMGVNFNIKHVRPTREDEVGSRVQVEAPMHASRVMHYDEKEGKAGHLGIRIEKLDNGAIVKVRYNKATGNRIPVVKPPKWVPVLERE